MSFSKLVRVVVGGDGVVQRVVIALEDGVGDREGADVSRSQRVTVGVVAGQGGQVAETQSTVVVPGIHQGIEDQVRAVGAAGVLDGVVVGDVVTHLGDGAAVLGDVDSRLEQVHFVVI